MFHLQELFPRSYAETADWLRRERTAYHDTLARCDDQLKTALETDPQLISLGVTCQARHFQTCLLLLSRVKVAHGVSQIAKRKQAALSHW